MSPLIKKEIRLILPAWIVAVSVAIFPPWIGGAIPGVGVLFVVVISMLAIASFSRESSLGTFSQLLAQPISRRRLWRTKVAVLFAAMLTLLVALTISGILRDLTGWRTIHSPMSANTSMTLEAAGIFMVAALGGGLLTSVVLRQFAAAFWITLLGPVFIAFTTARLLEPRVTDSDLMIVMFIVCAIYGIAGFVVAGFAFLRAQDIPWTGKTITLPSLTFSSDRARRNKQRGPVAALLIKEFRLQEINFIFAGALIVLHLTALFVHPHLQQSVYKASLPMLILVLWMILPALIGGSSVAEERRLGTADAGLTLPVSRRFQFAIKLAFILGAGLFLGVGLPVIIESLTGNRLDFSHPHGDPFLTQICVVAFISFISFYASTLSRNLLQALAVSLACGGIICVVGNTVSHQTVLTVHYLNWRLLVWTATPIMLIAFLYLAFQNFKTLHQGLSLGRRNLTVIVLTFAGVLSLNAAVYERFWEVFVPESAHGAARFATENPPIAAASYRGNLKIKLPDGRCWVDNLDPIDPNRLGGPLSAGPQAFLPGTNWLQIGTLGWLTVGVRNDGTLWASPPLPDKKHFSVAELINAQTNLIQLGTDSDWAAIAGKVNEPAVALLKTNGTLWKWSRYWPHRKSLESSRQQPQQLGTDADWAHLVSISGTFAFKADGTANKIDTAWNIAPCQDCFDSPLYLRNTALGHQPSVMEAAVKSDGTLWFFLNRNFYGNFKNHGLKPFEKIQVDSGANWIAATLCERSIIAVNRDGSLWKWHLKRADNNDFINHSTLTDPPVRMNDHKDWVAVTSTYNTVIGVSADGSVWTWELDDYGIDNRLFAPSKKPKRLATIIDDSPLPRAN